MTEGQIIAVRPTKVIYLDGDKVIKAFNEGYSKADILNEALNHARVEETGLSIPKILGVTTIEDKWSIELEYVEGPTLQQLMEQNPDKMDQYLEQFIDLQMEVHSKKAPLLNLLKDKLANKITKSALDATTRYELQTKLDTMPKHNKVCHGDFNPSNIIVGKDGKFSLLDWSHATQGNASADVALTYIEFLLSGKKDLAEKYLRLYSKKSDTAIQYIQQWIPIVAAGQLAKASPEDKKFLLQFVDVVEY